MLLKDINLRFILLFCYSCIPFLFMFHCTIFPPPLFFFLHPAILLVPVATLTFPHVLAKIYCHSPHCVATLLRLWPIPVFIFVLNPFISKFLFSPTSSAYGFSYTYFCMSLLHGWLFRLIYVICLFLFTK